MKLKIYIHGEKGRMGQELAKLIAADKNISLEENSAKAQVIVDFTSPEGTLKAIEIAEKNKIPLVSGSTGLSKKEFAALQKLSKKVAVLWAPNMSLGVATLAQMLKNLSAISDYDFYIEETHHIHKKDAPSGTALFLQEKLEQSIDKKIKQNISLRGGGVFGQHRVVILGPEETLILQHDALNRTVFARGAITCAKWICRQKAGYYQMGDVLNESKSNAP